MNDFLNKISLVFKDKILRKRIFFVLFALILFRALSAISIPAVDPQTLGNFLSQSQFLGFFNMFSGGGLTNLSIMMLGVGPYITASIIMQLLTIISPKLKALYHEEGEVGRKKFSQYSRLLTIPLALVQGFGFITLLKTQGVLGYISPFDLFLNLTIITAGSVLLMWIGELISEYGIGNGVSILIFGGIVSSLPVHVSQALLTFSYGDLPLYVVFVIAAILVTLGVVVVTEAERPIPITYAKRIRGSKIFGGISTYLPLRVNQAGVIPIIFALSILLFPQMIFQFLSGAQNELLSSVSKTLLSLVENDWFYSTIYFILVFVFTYFYTAVTFDPDSVSTNLQKNGAFIPGIRPGKSTSVYISKVLTRLTLVGAVFLGLIAVLPLVIRNITDIASIAIGGTSLLIVVSVVIDLIKKVDAQISIREY